MTLLRRASIVSLFFACACAPPDIKYPALSSLSAPAGKGGFRFGVATAATQIEDQDTNTDWWWFTAPASMGGLGKGAAFVGDAADAYTHWLDDVGLMQQLHVDSYRFSIEWARVEPQRGVFDENALMHYSMLIDALRAAGIKPLVTVHHFSNPVWVDDPRDPDCANGPSDTNLCGLAHPTGGPMIADELGKFAAVLAQRFGDRVDEWGTINEPINYLLAAYGVGEFPPGQALAVSQFPRFVTAIRNYLDAHAKIYDAIKANDTIDADGDGVPAAVGCSLSVAELVPSQDHAVSNDPDDAAARDRVAYVYHALWVDSITKGSFDSSLVGTASEPHPEWQGKIDWLGLQYYARIGVTSNPALFPVVNATPCFAPLDLGSCIPPTDPTFCVPAMGYEYYAQGLYDVLIDFSTRYPSLPLVVSEGGIATTVGARRAENVVRSLEQIDRARQKGVDVRGYYHWSLTDNFEWALGFVPRFGLYTVDYSTFARTATEGATVYGEIAGKRDLASSLRAKYGGTGAMTREGAPNANGLCTTPP